VIDVLEELSDRRAVLFMNPYDWLRTGTKPGTEVAVMMLHRKPDRLPTADEALPGRDGPIVTPGLHHMSGRALDKPYPGLTRLAMFGLGCFWGAERIFWEIDGVWVTAVGYAGGVTPNPTYEEVCSGMTGHAEVVRVVYRPEEIAYETLLKAFWESHDPTQGMRQGGDVGTQYRSAIYCYDEEQTAAAKASSKIYQQSLHDTGLGAITSDILDAPKFYFAEECHQQYLSRNPGGTCGIGGTGVVCPIRTAPA
jgi:peptide-methionine (S)-S-oxide reductase